MIATLAFALGIVVTAISFRIYMYIEGNPLKLTKIKGTTFTGTISFDEFGKTFCANVSNGLFFASGTCWDGVIKGEKGLIISHPLTKEVPSVFVITLGNITNDINGFSFKAANIADALKPLGLPVVSGDTRIVVIVDPRGDPAVLVDDFIISAEEGWVTKEYDLTQFRGKVVDVYIYGFAGGRELWNGEWYGIGDFSLLRS